MGFKLPGKSITSGTSGHSSALKMQMQQNAASLQPSPMKAAETKSQAYRRNRNAGEDTFTYNGESFSTESASEKEKRGNKGEYKNKRAKEKEVVKEVVENPVEETKTKEGTPEPEKYDTSNITIKDDGKKTDKDVIITSGKNQNASKVDDTEKQSNIDVAKSDLRGTKKANKITELKAKKDVADAKGKSRKSARLERKIERKETGMTRRDQRKARKAEKNKATEEGTPEPEK